MGVGVINHNISAINSLRTLQRTSMGLDKSLQKLSSGLRINSSADDAAGLAVSEKMRAQLKGLEQANRNAQDGISMLQTAEGVLDTLHHIIQRMRVLAIQAANDTYTSYDRRRIQEEVDQLIGEVDRIGAYTEFNTKKLLNGDTLGLANSQNPMVLSAEVVGRVADADYSITVLSAGTACNIHGNANIKDGDDPDNIVNLRDIGVKGTEELHIVVNGQTTIIDVHEDDTLSDVVYKINSSRCSVRAGLDEEGNDITITSVRSGPKFNISFGDDPDGLALKLGFLGGAPGSLTSSIDALDSTGNPVGKRVFTTGKCTVISITNITQQAQFSTSPGDPQIPGGFGRSLGVFVSDSDIFTERELTRPINTYSTPVMVGNLQIAPQWNDVHPLGAGDGIIDKNDAVDLSQSLLLKGIVIYIDEDLDYGKLQQTRDNDYSIGSTDPNRNFTSVYPDPNGKDMLGNERPGDFYGIGYTDSHAATPLAKSLGSNPTNIPNDPYIYGDTTSLWSTRLSVRDRRQKFHIGANADQTMVAEFANCTSEGLGLSWNLRSGGTIHDGINKLYSGALTNDYRQRLSVQTQKDAENAITTLDDALTVVSKTRSRFGSYMSALDKTVYYLDIAAENQAAAESRIRDVDMASEMTEFTKNQILLQSGTAMLAQANSKAQTVLQLLG